MSRRPHPKTGFGTSEPEKDPQSTSLVSGTAERSRRSSVASTSPRSLGTADQISAIAPATCGAAADVPENRK